jgi:hypothetical protein
MEDGLDYIERLAARAQQEVAPQGDVSRRVLSRLPGRGPSFATSMAMFTLGYAAAASIALVYGISLLQTFSDPFTSVFQMASVIAP